MTPARTPALAPDPRIVARDALLDGDRVSSLLGRAGCRDGSALRFERIRTKYRFGSSLRVLYRAVSPAGSAPALLSVRAFPHGERKMQLDSARERGARNPALAPAGEIVGLDALYWRFPNDRKLSGLRDLEGRSAAVASLIGEECDARLVSYAPEKAATVRCRSLGGETLGYVKLHATAASLVSGAAAAHLGDADRSFQTLRIPRTLGLLPGARLIAVEALPGQLLSGLRGAPARRAVFRLGQALGEFHGITPPEGSPGFTRTTPRRLAAAGDAVGLAAPRHAEALRRLVGRLHDTIPDVDEPSCLHGDLHVKNALLSGDRIGLIDMDQLASGPAACDLGSFVASAIAADVVEWGFPGGRGAADCFLRGYSSRRTLPSRDALRWHVAAALLSERILRALNRLRPRSLARLGELVSAADFALDGGFDA